MEQLTSFHPLANNLDGEQFLRGHKTSILILTGSKGIGKTTLCQQLIQRCQVRDLSLGGLLSQAQFENGRKIGIYLEDLQTGEKSLLGKDEPDEGYSYKVGGWYFSPEVLQWGNACLEAAAGEDIVIFDECGFLELKHGEGLQSGLELFDGRDFKLGVVVVRPSLLPIAKAHWPGAVVIDLDEQLV